MSLLTVILILAMLLWSVGFVVVGIVLAEEVLWRRPAGQAAPPVSRTRKIGAMGLLAIGGILVVTALVAAPLSLLTIAVAWFAFRPLLSVGLVALAAVLVTVNSANALAVWSGMTGRLGATLTSRTTTVKLLVAVNRGLIRS